MVNRRAQHGLDLIVSEPVGWLHIHAGFSTAVFFARVNTQQAVGVHLEGHANAGRTGHLGRKTAQFEPRQRAAVGNQFSLALHHVQRHRGLPVLVGGKEVLRPRHRYRRIAVNDLLGQPAHGFNAERERNNIQQQHILTGLVANQHIGLQRGADRDDLVRIDADQGFAFEEFPYPVAHIGNAGRPADHHDLDDIAVVDAGIAQGTAARKQRLAHHGLDQAVQLIPRQTAAPADTLGFYR